MVLVAFCSCLEIAGICSGFNGAGTVSHIRVGIDGCRSRANHNSALRAGRSADWSPRSTADDTQHFFVNVQIDLRLDSTSEICKFVLDG